MAGGVSLFQAGWVLATDLYQGAWQSQGSLEGDIRVLAHPDYEPLTRGMQAALPHVDHFLSGNSLASLAHLADLMEGGLR